MAREILQRAGYSSEPLSGDSGAPPPPAVDVPGTAVRTLPTIYPVLPSSAEVLEEILETLPSSFGFDALEEIPETPFQPLLSPQPGQLPVLSSPEVLLSASSAICSFAAAPLLASPCPPLVLAARSPSPVAPGPVSVAPARSPSPAAPGPVSVAPARSPSPVLSGPLSVATPCSPTRVPSGPSSVNSSRSPSPVVSGPSSVVTPRSPSPVPSDPLSVAFSRSPSPVPSGPLSVVPSRPTSPVQSHSSPVATPCPPSIAASEERSLPVSPNEHQSTPQSEGVDMGGQVIGGSPIGSPTPARTSRKRRGENTRVGASARKRIRGPTVRVASSPAPPGSTIRVASPPATNPVNLPSLTQLSNEVRHALGIKLVKLHPIRPDGTAGPSIEYNANEVTVQNLFRSFTSGERMVSAILLLDAISKRPQSQDHAHGLDLFGPITSLAEIEGPSPIGGVLVASRRAKRFLDNTEIHPSYLRLKTLMSYITLYFALEYAIVPHMRRINPTMGPKEISQRKYRYFYRLLMENSDEHAEEPPDKFAKDISFGKTPWGLTGDLGIAALLMLAVGETGLTMVARATGPLSRGKAWLTTALSADRGWWSFAHAIGPATYRTFFGPRDTHFTAAQLLQMLRVEPLPTITALQINSICQQKKIEVALDAAVPTEAVDSVMWAFAVGECSIAIRRHPTAGLDQKFAEVDVWAWMASMEPLAPAFKFLHASDPEPPVLELDKTIDFFCRFYNKIAIPGRRAVPLSQLRAIHQSSLNPDSLTRQKMKDILADETDTTCDILIFAAPLGLPRMFCGVVFYLKANRLKIYSWAERVAPGLARRAGDVSK